MEVRCCWCHICAKNNLESVIPDHLEVRIRSGSAAPLLVLSTQQLLPEGYCHFLCSYTPLEGGFKIALKLQLDTKEEAERWLVDFQRSSRVTLRVAKKYPNTADRVRHNRYRVDMRCQHNTRNIRETKKNMHCPAVLHLVLKKNLFDNKRKSRSNDDHIHEGLLLRVTIKHNHNHPLDSAEILRHRDVSSETVEKLEKLFQSGYSPTSALSTLKYDLQKELGDSYAVAAADRFICPDIGFCYRLYYTLFKRNYGAPSGDSVIEDLRERLELYNNQKSEMCALMETTADKQTVIALCTPVMKRIHRLETHSGEMIFVDSPGKFGRMNSRIFVLLTHSAAGGLPLGVILTSSKSQNTIASGLKLLQTLLPEDAFYGRGQLGPKVVMTDDCKALRNALKTVFPQTTPLLSVLHMLHSTWTWLWDSHHQVPKVDRQWLLDIFKTLLYAVSPAELEALYHQALKDPVVLRHHQYRDYLTRVFRQRRDWAHCLVLPTGGSDTHHFLESAMRVLKDGVFYSLFYSLKAHNHLRLVDFICTRLEAYYITRLLDVANGRTVRCDVTFDSKCPYRIAKEDESNYSLTTDKGYVYLVNISMGICTCPAGRNGGDCKHQHYVMQTFNLQRDHHLPVTSTREKRSFYEMATGNLDVAETELLDWQFESGDDYGADPLSTEEEAGATTPSSPQDSGAEEDTSQCQWDVERIEQGLKAMCDDLMDKMKKDDSFRAPVAAFLSSYEKLHTDSDLITALSTFGKVRSVAARKRKKTQPRRDLQMSVQNGEQSIAVARCETPLGERQSLTSGQPPKRTRREESCWKEEESGALLRPTPRCLVQCVSAAVSPGGQHNKD